MGGEPENYFRKGPRGPLMRREVVDTYPPFSRKIRYLALIPWESAIQALVWALIGRGKIAVISANPERFSGENLWLVQIRD